MEGDHLRGDGPCDDCGGDNIVWSTDDVLWNRVVRDAGPELILCPVCFVARAEARYHVKGWRLTIAPEMIERPRP